MFFQEKENSPVGNQNEMISEINAIKNETIPEETNSMIENNVSNTIQESKVAKTENSPREMEKLNENSSEKDNKFSVHGYDDNENMW